MVLLKLHDMEGNVMKAKAAVLEDIGKMAIREFDLPPIGLEDGLLKVEMAGVCGTDPKMYAGKIGKLWRADFPIIMGHEILGRIEEIGEMASQRWGVEKGDRVIVDAVIKCGHCHPCLTGNFKYCKNVKAYGTLISSSQPPHLWGAYAEYMYLCSGSIVYKISESIPAEVGVLINAVIADGIQWVRVMGKVTLGDVVVIQGVGQQGLAATIAAKESGADVVIVTGLTVDEERFRLAKEFGADFIIDGQKEDVVQKVAHITGGKMADVVVDVSGSPLAVANSLDLVKNQGTVVSAGLTGEEPTALLVDKIVRKEIRFQGVFASSPASIKAAIRLAESKKYPLEKIVSHKFPLEEAEKAVRTAGLMQERIYPIKVAIIP